VFFDFCLDSMLRSVGSRRIQIGYLAVLAIWCIWGTFTHMNSISLNKYISSSGFCSRREADKLIEQARVTINGELVIDNVRVMPGDKVEVDGERLKPTAKEQAIYIAFNKPVGVTSTTDLKDKTNIISYIGHPKRIFPIGRLDKDSDGLIFLTNDGDIVNKILRASNYHEKEYIVTVDKAITPEFITQMSNGVPVLDEMTRKCFVRQEAGRRFRIILTQGLNRQIRRMCEYLGYEVKELRRVRIMNIKLDVPLGKWRYFTEPEIKKLNELVAESSMVEKADARISENSKNSAGGRQIRDERRGKKQKTDGRKPPVDDREESFGLDEWVEVGKQQKKPVQYIPKRKPGGKADSDRVVKKERPRDNKELHGGGKGKPPIDKSEGKPGNRKAPAAGSFAAFRNKGKKR